MGVSSQYFRDISSHLVTSDTRIVVSITCTHVAVSSQHLLTVDKEDIAPMTTDHQDNVLLETCVWIMYTSPNQNGYRSLCYITTLCRFRQYCKKDRSEYRAHTFSWHNSSTLRRTETLSFIK